MSNLHLLADLIDDIALESPVDFESLNYEGMRDLAIQGALEQYYDLKNSQTLNEEHKELSIISIIAYLTMENTALHIQRLKSK